MSRAVSEEGIKSIILSKLRNRGCWGARYTPLDNLMHWLRKKIKRNGKRVQKAVRQLLNDGYLIPHKKGKIISQNPSRSREIAEFIRRIDKQIAVGEPYV